MAELRLLSWNVRSLRDDAGGVAGVIRAAEVDVALLQEVPRFARWRSKRAALAREAGLVVATADRVGGLCIATSMRSWVTDATHVELPATPRQHRRALVTATLSVARGPAWRVAVTHLGLDGSERLRHADAVRAALTAPGTREADAPLVLGADVNEEPGGAAWRRLGAGLTDTAGADRSPTYPTSGPRRRIDAVFADPRVLVTSYAVLDDDAVRRASDHLPVVVTLTDER